MNVAVVVLLVGLWAAMLLPALLRGHDGRSPAATIHSFERSMDILAARRLGPPVPPTGRTVLMPSDPARVTRSRALRRRRRVFQGLAAAVTATGLGAVAAGGFFVPLLAVSAGALCAYVLLLVSLRSAALHERRVVRRLDSAGSPARVPVGRRVSDIA